MQLINQTPLAAELQVTDVGEQRDGSRKRACLVVAKATFHIDAGRLSLVEHDPVEVLWNERPSELGLLPRDMVPPRPCSGLEVALLGAAYPEGGAPTTERYVRMRVGDLTRSLRVVGDREWAGGVASSPQPFTRMPLTWERAFGGTAEVWIDDHTALPLLHRWNALGRGLDAEAMAKAVAEHHGAAPSFPRLEYTRMLPNLEHPASPITSPRDEPEPYCWAPLPFELGLRLKWQAEAREQRRPELESDWGVWFAHRDWRLPEAPPQGAPVVVEGCRPRGAPFWFAWPAIRVVADYVLGSKSGSQVLFPELLVLMPEQSRATLTYRRWFRFTKSGDGIERSIRLRVEG